MVFFYVLCAQNRQMFRSQLNFCPQKVVAYSSCYEFDTALFLVVMTYVEVTTPWAGQRCYSSAAEPSAYQLMLNWAISEVSQSHDFIQFETAASETAYGCSLLAATQRISRDYRPLMEQMLIINQTPDSFSDSGGLYQNLELTLAKIEGAVSDGVSLIDIGAESTRPGATPLDAASEIHRLADLLTKVNALKCRPQFRLSLDSYRPETILHFCPYIDIVNDVSGRLPANALREICIQGKTYLFMHSLTIPAQPQINLAPETDPLAEVITWGKDKIHELMRLGFNPKNLIIDPGIGFNKTAAQSWYLLRKIGRLRQLGVEVLVGHSRKRFLNKVTANDFGERDWETAMISGYLAEQGVDYVRVHDYTRFNLLARVNAQLRGKA